MDTFRFLFCIIHLVFKVNYIFTVYKICSHQHYFYNLKDPEPELLPGQSTAEAFMDLVPKRIQKLRSSVNGPSRGVQNAGTDTTVSGVTKVYIYVSLIIENIFIEGEINGFQNVKDTFRPFV